MIRILFAILLLSQPLFAGIWFRADVPTLINGEVMSREKFRATVWIGSCTATLLGSRVVATAAHCVGKSTAFSLGTNRYTAKCLISDDYDDNDTADYALCFTDRDVSDTPYYEKLATDPQVIQSGDWVLQSGFGCTQWGTRLDGQFRVGRARVLGTPRGKSNDIVTGEGAVLCSGDSGGAAWTLDQKGERDLVVSVNSRSDTKSRSFLSSWVTPSAKETITDFLKKYPEALICGVHASATKCRNGGDAPPPPPDKPVKFLLTGEVGYLLVTIQPGANYTEAQARAVLDIALKGVKP